MLQKFTLGTDMNVSNLTVPVEANVHPLCVIPDIGGDSNEYFVILPKKIGVDCLAIRLVCKATF